MAASAGYWDIDAGDSLTFAFCHISWGIACPVVLNNRNFRGEDAAARCIDRYFVWGV